MFVVEASSFRLGHTRRFAPARGHVAQLRPRPPRRATGRWPTTSRPRPASGPTSGPTDGVAVANADDPVVMAHVRDARAHGDLRTRPTGADYHVDGRTCCGPPTATVLVAVDELPRSLPHDVANALAASATALEGGAVARRRAATRCARSRGCPTGSSLVGDWAGVSLVRRLEGHHAPRHARPRCAAFARRSCSIAGGRNKGLDLSVLAAAGRPVRRRRRHRRGGRRGRRRLRRPRRPVAAAASMDEAVRRRRRPGRGPATSCCCRRRAPRSTGTPTTPSGATTSPPPFAAGTRRPAHDPPDLDPRRPGAGRPASVATGRRTGTAGRRSARPDHDDRPSGGQGSAARRSARRAAIDVVHHPADPGGRADPGRPGHGAVGVVGRRRYYEYGSSWYQFKRQLLWVAIGMVAMVVDHAGRLPRAGAATRTSVWSSRSG